MSCHGFKSIIGSHDGGEDTDSSSKSSSSRFLDATTISSWLDSSGIVLCPSSKVEEA
eukprot:CAMPEP_0170349726 /NCGR_PEP_ID=MMETSP0116_2-20130129/76153_1 /TAXON_ID=400756 /ORGANISM="Durinskia baltica, Strain CSIRO CS-38" /LENGTH=56 /DNA_ID=CAMNT_0010603609 /DNA_START=79 /DNA_END=245 /DNA_ORIENTATION=+